MIRALIGLCVALLSALPALATAQPIDFADSAQADEVRVGIAADRPAVSPGGRVVLAIVLDHAPGYHSQVRQEELNVDSLIPTTLSPKVTGGRALPIQWPQAHLIDASKLFLGVDHIPTYEGRAVFFIPVLVDAAAPPGSTLTASVDVGYQSCNDATCLPPAQSVRTITLPVVAADDPSAQPAASDLFATFQPSIFDAPPPPSDSASAPGPDAPAASGGAAFFGLGLDRLTGPVGLAALIGLGIVGGLLLNLTPCVLPVIPIKVLTLSQHAGTPGRSLLLGSFMAAGVIAFWVGIGIPVVLINGFAAAQIFAIWWVTLAIGLMIAVMSLGLMGLFTLNLPKQAYMFNPKADTAYGSFMFGVMTAVLGLPCFGFVATGMLGVATKFGSEAVLAIFGSIGVGMALPYFALALNPKWIDKLPRTGPASELVKQVMGLLLLSAGAYFIGSGLIALVNEQPWLGKQLHWWAVAIFASLAGLWLILRTVQISKKPLPIAAFSLVGLAIGAAGVLYALDTTERAEDEWLIRKTAEAAAQSDASLLTSTWMPYTPQILDRALTEGYVVVLDFTAEWCLNCKALEGAVLNQEPVRSLLAADDTVMLKADLTSLKDPAWDKLRELGYESPPALLVYTPAKPEPIWVASAYTSGQVEGAIAKARELRGPMPLAQPAPTQPALTQPALTQPAAAQPPAPAHAPAISLSGR